MLVDALERMRRTERRSSKWKRDELIKNLVRRQKRTREKDTVPRPAYSRKPRGGGERTKAAQLGGEQGRFSEDRSEKKKPPQMIRHIEKEVYAQSKKRRKRPTSMWQGCRETGKTVTYYTTIDSADSGEE